MPDFQHWLALPIKDIDVDAHNAAFAHQQQLTKPTGSLGQLENIAIKLAGLQATATPSVDNVQITVFAADHGIVEQGVSAFPQSVTAEMIRNFSAGGAAISVLAKENNARLSVINLGTVTPLEPLENVEDARISSGTRNFYTVQAMTQHQCQQAMLVGAEHINSLTENAVQLFIGGEMGIGNTTSATAIACALLNKKAQQLVGAGTGLDQQAMQKKATIIEHALTRHHKQLNTPLSILRTLGGFEIAALTGAYLQCAKLGIPVLIDGFISSVAALLAQHIQDKSQQWFLFSHQSAEQGHQKILSALNATPMLNLDMRLGEASGAAVALPLLKLSCALHNAMATFSQASVSKND